MLNKITFAVIAALASFCVPAIADTYADNVFRRGEPRWGSSPRHYENRNVQPRGFQGGGRVIRGGGMSYGGNRQMGGGGFTTTTRTMVGTWRRVTLVRGAASAVDSTTPVVRVTPLAPRIQHAAPVRSRRSFVATKPVCNTCKTGAANAAANSIAVKTGNQSPVNITIQQSVGSAAAPVGLASVGGNISAPPAAFHTVSRVVGMTDKGFCFVDEAGVTSYTSRPHVAGAKFQVRGGTMYWFD